MSWLNREPVLLGAAAMATFEAAAPQARPAVKIAVGAWVAYGQRLFSRARSTADQQAEDARTSGYHQAVSEVSQLNAHPAVPVWLPAEPERG